MAKGKILRVPSDTVLADPLLNSLKQKFPGGLTEESFDEKTANYKACYQRRAASLHAGFLLALEAYPLKPKTNDQRKLSLEELANFKASLKHTADTLLKNCKFTSDSIDELQKKLKVFTDELITQVNCAWHFFNKEEAKDCLNVAEQYALMNKGRNDLMTLTPIGSGEYALQVDEVVPAHYPQLIAELQQIKKEDFPHNTIFFRQLPIYQKAYLCNLSANVHTAKHIEDELNSFLSSYIKNLSYRECEQIAKGNYPEWFKTCSPQMQNMLKVLVKEPANIELNIRTLKDKIVELNTNDSVSFKKFIGKVSKIPEWYWELSDHEQYLLENVLTNSTNIEETFSFLCSRHRSIPAPANFSKHTLYVVGTDGKITPLGSERYRSSHIVSREALEFSPTVQLRHSQSNLSCVTAAAKPEQPQLIQTLTSPFGPFLALDKKLDELKKQTIRLSGHAGRIYYPNHPLNMAKYFIYTTTEDPYCIDFKRFIETQVQNFPKVAILLEEYKNLLASPPGTATLLDYRGRELFLASLEQLMIMEVGGFSYGSCVSGKDRKAVELMHTDAMLLYKHKYGSWPNITDSNEKRNDFVSLVAKLYCSRHQHEHAGQNAPGSEGLKYPDHYLPKDICKAIAALSQNSNMLSNDNKLASNNEVEYIISEVEHITDKAAKLLVRYFPSLFGKAEPSKLETDCLTKALYLGETNCRRLYDVLSLLMNQLNNFKKAPTVVEHVTNLANLTKSSTSSFHTTQQPALATGIQAILKVMQYKDMDIELRMAKIFVEVENRRTAPIAYRAPVTQKVYSQILKVMDATDDKIPMAVDEAVKVLTCCFEEGKAAFARSASTGDLVELVNDFSM
ncbi:MAG: hypothetical protein EPN84_01450 [Legionella sp.]|nr:MAG: hypothetical protein EPN84_01450 [Legionella sp.]